MPEVTQDRINAALIKMGPKQLRTDLRDDWSESNPTRNYCYVVAEFVYWYVAPKGSTPMELKLPGELASHRYIQTPAGDILDYSAEQFDFLLDYSKARPKMFMQTGGEGPSKRARMLAELLGFSSENPRNLLTHGEAPTTVTPTTTHVSKENEMLVGKYKGHEIRGEPVKDGFKIVSWTRGDGVAVAQKTTKGIVDHTFKSVSQAGHEVYVRMNRDFGFPENLDGRHLKFSTDSDKPARKSKPAAEKAEKPSKSSTKAAERETKPAKGKSTKQDVAASNAKTSGKAAKSAPAATAKSSGGKSKKGGSTEAGDDSSASGSKGSTRARAPFKLIKEHDNQEDVRDGSTRYLCFGCLKSFVAKTSKKLPAVCPEGHRYDRTTDNVVIDKKAAAELYAGQETDDDYEDLFGGDDSSDDDDGDAEEDEDEETEDDDSDDDADDDDDESDDADSDDDDDFASLFDDEDDD